MLIISINSWRSDTTRRDWQGPLLHHYHRQSGHAAHLTEQGDVGGGRCEPGVRTQALDERRRSRDLHSDDDGHDFDRDGENIDDVDEGDYDDVIVICLDGCRVLYPLSDPVDSGTRHIGLGGIRYEHHHVFMTATMIAMKMKVLIILVLTLGQQCHP